MLKMLGGGLWTLLGPETQQGAQGGAGGQQATPPAATTTPAAPSTGPPAVHVDKGFNKEDVLAYIAEHVGKSVAEAMKKGEEEARQQLNLPSSKAFELKPYDIERAMKKPIDGQKGMMTASYMGWMFRGMGDPDKAYRIAKKAGADERILRALGESTMAAGGAFVPQMISNDYIELLYAVCPFLQAGPRRVPVPSGNLTVPRVATGATSAWLGESVNISKSEQTFGQVRLDLKKLAVLTPVSNELLRDSNPAVEPIIRDDLANNAAVVIDTALLRSLGTAYAPRGIRAQVAAANTFNANATANVANVTADLTKCPRLLQNAKIRFIKPAWFMSPTVFWGLMAARDAQGQLVWAPEMVTGKLYGMPFYVTTNIPSDLGGTTDESEIYLVEMSHVMVGDDPMGVQIAMADGVAYHDGSAVQAAFSRDETVIRLIQRIDMVLRQLGNEAVLMEQVDWDIITAT